MEAKILHMEVILQQKLDESNVFCYSFNLIDFGAPSE